MRRTLAVMMPQFRVATYKTVTVSACARKKYDKGGLELRMKRIRVMLGDDHALIQDGVRASLQDQFEIAGEAYDGKALVDAGEKLRTERIRVLLGDDHALILDGVRASLQDQFEIAGEAYDGKALVDAAEKLRP